MSSHSPDDPWPESDSSGADEPLFADEEFLEEEAEPAWEVIPALTCWRCGFREAPVRGRCAKCHARLVEDHPSPSQKQWDTATAGSAGNPVVAIVVVYTLMLAVSVAWGWLILLRTPQLTSDEIEEGTIVVEVIDTILVLVAIAMMGRGSLPTITPGVRTTAWVLAAPVLAALVYANVLYAEMIRDILRQNQLRALAPTLDLGNVLMICMQPAIVEELFFRYLAFGVLFRAVGIHTAVWVTAVMFAGVHIYNPLGMPYLFIAGVVFGYARVWGGLALPMAMHFIHNFAVLAIEGG